MSPHNTRYNNKVTSASPCSIVSKHSPPSSKSKPNPKAKSPPRSMSSASSSSSSTSASGAPSKPKRPLSAYNLFFKFARDEMLASTASSGTTTYDHSKHATTLQSPSARRDLSKRGRPPPHRKIGFAEMARQIGAQWKALDDDRREHFEALARVDKQRYLKEMEAWKAAGGDKELPQKDKKNAPGNKGATSKTTSARKSPASSPRSKKSKKKSKVDVLETPAIDNLQTILDQTCEPPSANNIPRTVSARSSISKSSAESPYDSWANTYHNSVGEPRMHYQQQQNQSSYKPYHTDFQPPHAATTARRVSEGSDGGDFLSDTYSTHAQYNRQQQHSYGTHHGNWQHQSGQPPYYPYQQIAPGDVAPSSLQRRHQISYNDFRNVSSISSADSVPRANKIAPSNWNATIWDYPVADNPADSSNQSQKIWQSTETAPSSSAVSVVDVHKNSDPKWADIDDTDGLLDVLGTIDDEDVKFWGTANPMA